MPVDWYKKWAEADEEIHELRGILRIAREGLRRGKLENTGILDFLDKRWEEHFKWLDARRLAKQNGEVPN